MVRADFRLKLHGKPMHFQRVWLQLDRITSGKYSVSMVEYNMKRQIESWLSNIYNEYYKKLSKAD